MLFTSQRERRLWSAAGLCVALIYSTLYIARPVADVLRDRNLLRLAVTLVFVAVTGWIAWYLAVTRPGKRVWVTAGLIGAFYFGLLSVVPMLPEECLHFLEYGVVAILIYLALSERRIRTAESSEKTPTGLASLSPFLLAVVATGVLGWIDEGIQAFVPNRYYDLRDVAFNATAGVLSLLSLKLIAWAADHE